VTKFLNQKAELQFGKSSEEWNSSPERKKRKKKFGEHLAAENPKQATAFPPPLGPYNDTRLYVSGKYNSSLAFSLVAMYAQRPLAYAPTPYSYTPNPSLTASINLDEVFRSGCLLCGIAG